MKRFEVDLTICPSDKSVSSIETLREVIIAKLADGPYDAFEETNSGVKAYLDADLFDKEFLDNSINDLKECDSEVTCSYEVVELADKNYNEEWEKQHKAELVKQAETDPIAAAKLAARIEKRRTYSLNYSRKKRLAETGKELANSLA